MCLLQPCPFSTQQPECLLKHNQTDLPLLRPLQWFPISLREKAQRSRRPYMVKAFKHLWSHPCFFLPATLASLMLLGDAPSVPRDIHQVLSSIFLNSLFKDNGQQAFLDPLYKITGHNPSIHHPTILFFFFFINSGISVPHQFTFFLEPQKVILSRSGVSAAIIKLISGGGGGPGGREGR